MAGGRRPVHVCQCSVCQSAQGSATGQYHQQINLLLSRLTEPQRRWYVASLVLDPAGPSATQLSIITGLSLPTIRRGRTELDAGLPDISDAADANADTPSPPSSARQRQPGGGRPRAEKKIHC